MRRTILDHRARAVHRFDGMAVVTPREFRETGTRRIGGAAFRTTRAYRLAASDSALTVLYADGRLFFETIISASAMIVHTCGNDLYRGRIMVRHANRWAEVWRVRGPAKNYSSLSHYERSPTE